MMNIEDQVCSLELAKHLKNLNVKQESVFYYRAWENTIALILKEEEVNDERWRIYYSEDKYSKCCDWQISAFTVSELGNFLSCDIASGKDFSGGYFCRAVNIKEDMIVFDDDNEANCRAKMLIHLIENNIIKIENLK